MKKVGIVCDNYKLETYKDELKKLGFKDFMTFKFTKETTGIRVQVPESRVPEIQKLCVRLENQFKRKLN
jgi:hypothetical protein